MRSKHSRYEIRVENLILLLALLISGVIASCRDYAGVNNAQIIRVKFTDYNMELEKSDEIEPGKAIIQITNNGKKEHSFVFEGTDTIQRLEENLKPGETGTISVELEPTSYNIYCPLDDHKNKGMSSVLKVEEPEGEKTMADY